MFSYVQADGGGKNSRLKTTRLTSLPSLLVYVTLPTRTLHCVLCCGVLKPGGRLLVLEFSKPEAEMLSKAYDLYSFHIMPRMGEFIAKDKDSYQYLAESDPHASGGGGGGGGGGGIKKNSERHDDRSWL